MNQQLAQNVSVALFRVATLMEADSSNVNLKAVRSLRETARELACNRIPSKRHMRHLPSNIREKVEQVINDPAVTRIRVPILRILDED